MAGLAVLNNVNLVVKRLIGQAIRVWWRFSIKWFALERSHITNHRLRFCEHSLARVALSIHTVLIKAFKSINIIKSRSRFFKKQIFLSTFRRPGPVNGHGGSKLPHQIFFMNSGLELACIKFVLDLLKHLVLAVSCSDLGSEFWWGCYTISH